MTKDNLIRRKPRLGKRVLIVLAVIFAAVYVYLLFKLFSGSYFINENKLIKLNNISIQSQAYVVSGGRYGGNGISFEDVDRHPFECNQSVFASLMDKRFVSDTLKYHGTKLNVYTDQEGFETYRKSLKDKTIAIYQLEIGNKKYVNIENLNKVNKNTLVYNVCLFTIVLIWGFISYMKMKRKLNPIDAE